MKGWAIAALAFATLATQGTGGGGRGTGFCCEIVFATAGSGQPGHVDRAAEQPVRTCPRPAAALRVVLGVAGLLLVAALAVALAHHSPSAAARFR